MKSTFKIILIFGFCYLVQLYFPWWSAALVAFLVNTMLEQKAFKSFLTGFLGVGLLWLFMAWRIDYTTNSILTNKIAALFQLGNTYLLIFISCLPGALTGGFSALSGKLFRDVFKSKVSGEGSYY
ncbi:hypothetical protein [Xanthovirga aplysinae]|uniref:hypothetical protein n=1 Tax=Xanthovirga aplysinae TaxID=2529853 RepID=UPI0012BC18C8|nr:hypothetical protein [Xanthovirga aplysinae]MTI30944.1 hypothetical protein [Xanthovirga aplysinae]